MDEKELRERAEMRLTGSRARSDPHFDMDPQSMAYELEVHRTEIELQSEELHARERELKAATERLAAIVQTAVDAILTIDEDGFIESFNPAAEALFGYQAAEALGSRVVMLIPPPDRDAFDERLAAYQNGDLELMGLDVEVTCQRRDGTTFPASLVVSEMELHGRRLLTGIVRDLSDKKELEEQLRHAQKMEAIGTLATGVAHDFNNLLMGISGCVELASRHVPFGSEAQTHLEDVREAAKTGADISNQLLSFARRQKSRNKRFLVDDVVRRVVRLIQTMVGEEVQLDVRLRGPDGFVFADPTQFEQVLMNLAINSRDAMPDGGVLRIRTETSFEVDPPGECEMGEYVRLSVEDTGRGIPPSVADRIFEPFFTTKQTGRGTGLGLSTVHGIVRSMKGHIDFETEVGRGTRFEVWLPKTMETLSEESSVAEVAPTSTMIRSGPGARRAPCTLVVEDDRLVRRTVSGYLRHLGHEVQGAPTIADALDVANAMESLDLVIADTVLTDGAGLKVVERLSKRFPRLGVVFMSAHGFDDLVRKEKLPADARFLQKPFTRDDLSREVQKSLKKHHTVLSSQDPQTRILIVDDHVPSREMLRLFLEEYGYSLLDVGTATEAKRYLEAKDTVVDVVVTDVSLPDETGPEFAQPLLEAQTAPEVVYISGYPREVAEERFGLPEDAEFLKKPFDLTVVLDIVRKITPRHRQ